MGRFSITVSEPHKHLFFKQHQEPESLGEYITDYHINLIVRDVTVTYTPDENFVPVKCNHIDCDKTIQYDSKEQYSDSETFMVCAGYGVIYNNELTQVVESIELLLFAKIFWRQFISSSCKYWDKNSLADEMMSIVNENPDPNLESNKAGTDKWIERRFLDLKVKENIQTKFTKFKNELDASMPKIRSELIMLKNMVPIVWFEPDVKEFSKDIQYIIPDISEIVSQYCPEVIYDKYPLIIKYLL